MYLKASLVIFGLLLGLLGSDFVLQQLSKGKEASEFQDLQALRRAMLERDSRDAKDALDGSVSLRSIIYPHPSDKIIFDLIPNLDVRFQKVALRTNSCGMRGPEISLVKPKDTFRIVLLGDSFAFGWGVEEEKIFARVMERVLNEKHAGRLRFEVLNLGVPGYSTFQEVARFKELGLDFDPDAVLVYFVQNDFGFPFYVPDTQRTGGLLSAVSFAKLSWRRADPAIEKQKQTLVRSDPNASIKELSELCDSRGIKLSIAFNPRSEWKEDRRRLPVLREKPHIRSFGLSREIARLISERKLETKELQLPDDPHPSAAKHQLLGELLASHFIQAKGFGG